MSKMLRSLTVSFSISVPDGVSEKDLIDFIKFEVGEVPSISVDTTERLEAKEIYDLNCLIPEDVTVY